MKVTLLSLLIISFSTSYKLAPKLIAQKSLHHILRRGLSSTMSELLKCDGNLNQIKANGQRLGYVDVHAHLIHERFENKEDEIAIECIEHGLDHVIVNGIEPRSNRKILEYCDKFSPYMQAAIGIYPLDAANRFIFTEEDIQRLGGEGKGDYLPVVNWRNEFPPPEKFDVDEEINFIEEMAYKKAIIAIGECGLDKHYLTDETSFAEQERVLRRLMQIGVKYDIPLILHSRKAEKRVFEMLLEEKVKKADFHCFCGKLKLGLQIAAAGYYLSIPSAVANSDQNSSFKKLASALPMDKILTETDSPYMGPVKGEDNTPKTVIDSIETIARLKNMDPNDVRTTIRGNFRTLFGL